MIQIRDKGWVWISARFIGLAFLFSLIASLVFFIFSPNKQEEEINSKRISVRIVHPPELKGFLEYSAEQFLIEHSTLPDGTVVELKFIEELPLTASKLISRGELKTDGWISSRSVFELTNASLQNLGPEQTSCHQIFSTPIVIATKSKDVSRFSNTGRQFSLKDLLLNNIKQFNQPDGSLLLFNHGSPLQSSTGLAALAQLSYIASGSNELISNDQFSSSNFVELFRSMQLFNAGYGMKESNLLQSVASVSGNKLHFTITTEQQLAKFNASNIEVQAPLVALYPSEGSYWLDYSVCVSDADWVSPGHRVILELFWKYITAEAKQVLGCRSGFRPISLELAATPPLTKDFGIDVSLPNKSLPSLCGEAANKLLNLWSQVRRPSAILFLHDTSGSTEGHILRLGKQGFRNMVATLPISDLRSVTTFASEIKESTEFSIDPLPALKALENSEGIGGSAVYDAIKFGIEKMMAAELRNYRRTIILYTDGEDKNSVTTLSSIIDKLSVLSISQPIDLIIIAANPLANHADLKQIAKATNGSIFIGDLDAMEGIFKEVMDNF